MKKSLHTLTACVALALIAQSAAVNTLSTSSVSALETPHDTGRTVLEALDMKAISGTGGGTDFACGFMSGAGLILTLSGVATPIGVTLAVGSVACSLLL